MEITKRFKLTGRNLSILRPATQSVFAETWFIWLFWFWDGLLILSCRSWNLVDKADRLALLLELRVLNHDEEWERKFSLVSFGGRCTFPLLHNQKDTLWLEITNSKISVYFEWFFQSEREGLRISLVKSLRRMELWSRQVKFRPREFRLPAGSCFIPLLISKVVTGAGLNGLLCCSGGVLFSRG